MRIIAAFLLAILASCATMEDAMTPDIPRSVAVLHQNINKSEKVTVADLEARVFDISKVNEGDGALYFNRIQRIKHNLNVFAQWLRKSGLDDRLYEATVTRLRVWEDMQAFFCVQEDAYLKDNTPLDEGTKAEVLKYLDFLITASNKTEKWIDEKGVMDNG